MFNQSKWQKARGVKEKHCHSGSSRSSNVLVAMVIWCLWLQKDAHIALLVMVHSQGSITYLNRTNVFSSQFLLVRSQLDFSNPLCKVHKALSGIESTPSVICSFFRQPWPFKCIMSSSYVCSS